jgi:hypothetical protein
VRCFIVRFTVCMCVRARVEMTLFVSGLPTTMEAAKAEKLLGEHFRQFGQIKQVLRQMRDCVRA